MKRLLAFAALVALGSRQSHGIESGERVLIQDQTYVVIHETDWGNLTNRVKMLEDVATDRWTRQHSTDAGRMAWHGAKRHTTVTNGETIVEYADGYKYVEKNREHAKPVAKRTVVRNDTPAVAAARERLANERKDGFLERRAAIRAARKKAMSVTNEVSVTIGR